jgi:proteasome lid subunit RPN8/RPN11
VSENSKNREALVFFICQRPNPQNSGLRGARAVVEALSKFMKVFNKKMMEMVDGDLLKVVGGWQQHKHCLDWPSESDTF